MILFFASNRSDESAWLEEDEFKHCCKVLRKQVGDIIHVTDGQGMFAEAEIVNLEKRSAQLQLKEVKSIPKSKTHVTLAIAPPKNRSRWEWLLEKSVELGVDTIVALKTKNSERSRINIDRIRKIIRSASLQSLRPYHPNIYEAKELKSFIHDIKLYDYRINHIFTSHFTDTELVTTLSNTELKYFLLNL